MGKRLTAEQIEDMRNAIASQQSNSVEGSAYSNADYCDRCGNIECTCLYKARKQAIQNGGGTASGPLAFICFVLFCLFFYLVYEYLTR